MQTRVIPEFDNYFKVAGVVFTSVFSFLLLLSWFLPHLNGAMTILLTGVVFLGIPHGALDIFLIQKISRHPSETRKLLFFYVLALIPMILAWTLVPEGAFLFFVVFSSFHFAQSDMIGKSKKFKLEFWTRFLTIFSLPFTFHTDEFVEVATYVLTSRIFDGLIPVFQIGAFLSFIGMFLIVTFYLRDYIRGKVDFTTNFLELPVIFILFYIFNPLYAFGIYFCFIHSVKHLFNVTSSKIQFRFIEILPYWLLPLLGVLLLIIFTGNYKADLEANSLQSLMMVISAIALPHTILINFCKKEKLIN